MYTKTCPSCNKNLPLSSFSPDKSSSSGVRSHCKKCCVTESLEWRKRNREQFDAYQKSYQQSHKETHAKHAREWHARNKEKARAADNKYYQANRHRILARQEEYNRTHKKSISEKRKHRYLQDVEVLREAARQYYQDNKEDIRKRRRKAWKDDNESMLKKQRALHNKKYHSQPTFRLASRIRNYVAKTISRHVTGAMRHLPYTVEQLKHHLELQFTAGMSWDNYGIHGWHIDHIIPISWWEFTSPDDDEFKQCWALANLQPLWASENLSKGARYTCWQTYTPCPASSTPCASKS